MPSHAAASKQAVAAPCHPRSGSAKFRTANLPGRGISANCCHGGASKPAWRKQASDGPAIQALQVEAAAAYETLETAPGPESELQDIEEMLDDRGEGAGAAASSATTTSSQRGSNRREGTTIFQGFR